jgi:glutamate synthase domain-containing protein 3
MSGGIAYVIDEEGDFAQRCNLQMVDLETITDAEEEWTVRNYIKRHAELTASARAQLILGEWNHYREKLVKIMPLEYRRVLSQVAAAGQQTPVTMVHHG